MFAAVKFATHPGARSCTQ